MNKKGAVGETITWIVATVIIIVILIFSMFIVSWAKDSKEFKAELSRDLIVTKSLSGYLLTEDASGEKVFEQITTEGDLNDFNGNLAQNIFLGLYKNEYREDRIWLGIYGIPGIDARKNIYFELPHVGIKGGDQNWRKTMMPYALEEINILDEKRSLILVLTN